MNATSIKDISASVSSELEQFDGYLREQMRSKAALLDTVIRYILRQRGKRVRPALVFLAAGACGGITDRAYVGAAMVELLHTATLVHDDVVDQADERRGMASINAVWKNKVAVLVGDFFLSKGLLIAVHSNEFDYLRVTSEAVRRMSEGELLQIQKSRQKTLDEETYFKIISDKTASLISTCCEIGAISASTDPAIRAALSQFGELTGLAFQIRDDVLDYTSRSSILGKPVGNDIREGKITLPLLYAAKNAPASEAKAAIKIVKSKRGNRKDIDAVQKFVATYEGTKLAQEKATELQQQAVSSLVILPESVFKTALIDFAHFVVTRTS
ncbi:MAG: polyprenyl synthetase family protein [Ignavibacteria bacterium]|nr:polyprenyl synthetase family protein [Ignavibacteria bacterium]MBP6508994.1 polyprenyl synthetase family protein [Candidatus Kapabacteria bacterium]MBK6420041.1 polyprenyl synthetase family protein [Ignavibacteria bacterium]MBK6759327.1 polyprenyl synthetase family protein [Ignavibacteria bacterium]MBK7185055.1 polyprenyl synthetase family protein [Ignavibacteria bacterium]